MAGLLHLMKEWLIRGLDLINEWRIRVVILLSFTAHVVLVLFAGIRRHKALGVRRFFLWLAYQGGGWAANYALSNLLLGSTSREQQLVAFWATFLLLHLGGPDNISAYSIDDNNLWGRQCLTSVAQGVLAIIVLFKHVFIGGSGTLFWAAVIMLAVGVAKFVERSLALFKGDLSHIQSSGKTHKKRTDPQALQIVLRTDQHALQIAHSLFYISKGAFADYSDDKDDDPHPRKRETRREPLPLEWRDMCKVVEMELSLMYDILYTKAAVLHTWHGYIIRVLSPPFTAAASLLFFFYSKDGQRRVDVVITYFLLAATFLLDLRWLLRALGSTWTYAYLDARCWLHHAFLCTGRWHRLRRVVVSMDLGPLLLPRASSSSYRMWSGSGTIGQYNFLHECTHDTTSLCSRLAKCVGQENAWNEYQYHYSRGLDISVHDVRKELFKRIRESLELAYRLPTAGYAVAAPGPQRRRKLDEALKFDPEFQEVILIWHIATDVFLLCSDQNAASPKDVKKIKAIEALSDYMVFLVSVRPYMLPGLQLQSLHRATRDFLAKIWRNKGSSSSSRISPGSTTREEKLARILLDKEEKGNLYDSSIILSDGTRCAMVLLKLLNRELGWSISGIIHEETLKNILKWLIPALRKSIDEDVIPALRTSIDEDVIPELMNEDEDEVEPNMETLLGLILEAWVRLLIYVSIRCSRDSHAKQLSRGGELTTIVWILAEHATYLASINDVDHLSYETYRMSFSISVRMPLISSVCNSVFV